MIKKIALTGSMILLAGCVATPQQSPQTTQQPPKITHPLPTAPTHTGVKITPYEREKIHRHSAGVPVVIPPKQKVQQNSNHANQLPVFKTLMQRTQLAYKQRQFAVAERYALQAQRIVPKAAETYLYLALIAQQRQQHANAQALAKRGLSYAQSNAMKKQLWLVVLKTAKAQQQPSQVSQAQKALQSL